MRTIRGGAARGALLGAGLLALGACGGGFDIDLRSLPGTSGAAAARQATTERPEPDDRGVIRYANYDVAVARRGDSVQDMADRVGVDAGRLARFNGLGPEDGLRRGEVLVLPERASLPAAGAAADAEARDLAALASDALNRADAGGAPAAAAAGAEPAQHQVVRGETAFTIARLYNVSVRSLADWNGLGPDLAVREGQYLLIPVALDPGPAPEEAVSAPGQGTVAPEPPSASTPLPTPEPEPAPEPEAAEPAAEAPAPAPERSATAPRLAMPVQGPIVRDYEKGANDGIDIAASPGAEVLAAGDGTVAAITRDANGVPILVLRHSENLLTVYANIDGVTLEKGARVGRGQKIATVRGPEPGFLHFEVREGFDSVDPISYLN